MTETSDKPISDKSTSDKPSSDKPWQELQKLVDEGEPVVLQEFLDDLTVGDTTLAVSRLDDESRGRLFVLIEPEAAADLCEQLPDVQTVEALDTIPAAAAAAILEQLPSDEQADLLAELEHSEQVLEAMQPEEAADARILSGYENDVAGGLMHAEYLAYEQSSTVQQVIDDLRARAAEYRDYDVQYAYVVDKRERLSGVLRLRDLLLARADQPLDGLMIHNPLTVHDLTTLDALRELFDKHHFLAVPVTREQDERLLGVIQRDAVEQALQGRAESDYRKSQGIVGGEELRTMPIRVRSKRRLAWLSVNVFLNIIAASVIAIYQETLEQVIALAVFLPIISDMSGCSGNQAVAVSMRELSLGLVRPTEALRVWAQELAVGVINGVALGALVASVAWMWKGNAYLGLVVGIAMAANTLIAVSLGGTLPLLLRKRGLDPALASGPILTTLTDLCGFFLVLSMASMMLERLAS